MQTAKHSEPAFRDTIATVDEHGKRVWIYPKMPAGKLHRWRIAASVALLALLFAGPFLRINGKPFFLFNVLERRFVIFGQPFWPQDFVLLALVLILFFVFIIFFTVVFGRIWCGWLCPQTLFMEMVFRKIEYWLEGDAPAQRRLDSQPWNFNKALRKGAKHVIFILISLVIGHTVMAYLIGSDNTLAIITQSPAQNLAGFIGLISFTGIVYGVYAKFREQACIAVCPYGRLQSVLLVKNSIVVAYDWLRGEPRGHIKKAATPTPETRNGDCVDCNLCVHVCPTGIDIRNGTQLECVNCTACIDACDDVMIKIGKPAGLIRYASAAAIESGSQKIITSRVLAYAGVLTALMILIAAMIMLRSDVKTTVLKVPGTLYQKTPEGLITNLYNVEFVNKTFDELELEMKVLEPQWAVIEKIDGKDISVKPEGMTKTVAFIKIPQSKVIAAKSTVSIGIFRNGELIESIDAKFIGPVSKSSDMKR